MPIYLTILTMLVYQPKPPGHPLWMALFLCKYNLFVVKCIFENYYIQRKKWNWFKSMFIKNYEHIGELKQFIGATR